MLFLKTSITSAKRSPIDTQTSSNTWPWFFLALLLESESQITPQLQSQYGFPASFSDQSSGLLANLWKNISHHTWIKQVNSLHTCNTEVHWVHFFFNVSIKQPEVKSTESHSFLQCTWQTIHYFDIFLKIKSKPGRKTTTKNLYETTGWYHLCNFYISAEARRESVVMHQPNDQF